MSLSIALWVERFSERRDLNLKIVLLDRDPGPYPGQKLILGDDLTLGGN